jgi:hypothetical protein
MSDPDDPTSSEPSSSPPPNPLARTLGDIRNHLNQLERLYGAGVHQAEARLRPLWREATEGENRLPVAAVIALAIVLQLTLPDSLALRPAWLLPSLEGALLIGLVAANPRRIERESPLLRTTSLLLIAAITVGNAWAAGHLIRGLIRGTLGSSAGPLLASGASIYVTNIILFGLWYWEFDRGGPVARLQGRDPYPDFLFPQMTAPELAPPEWRPEFVDYLYISFTNATAFSPTDVLPLTRWTKVLMGVQAGVSLGTVALVVARAVNILK